MTEPDYYETLGVKRDASGEELRKAFRRKAKQHHPDRQGGDAQKMARTNRAYETLSDPSRRLTYDKTGHDQAPDHIEVGAREIVIKKFMQWFGEDRSGDMLGWSTATVYQEIQGYQAQLSQGTQLHTKLKRKLKRLKFKGKGTNIIGFALDHQLEAIKQQIEMVQQNIVKHERAMILIKDFEFEVEVEVPTSQYMSFTRV